MECMTVLQRASVEFCTGSLVDAMLRELRHLGNRNLGDFSVLTLEYHRSVKVEHLALLSALMSQLPADG